MPNLPKKPCRKCGTPTDGAHCEACKPSAYNSQKVYNAKRDPVITRLYKTARWSRLRIAELIENAMRHGYSHPVCESCGKIIRDHSQAHADHIEPHRGDIELFFDPENIHVLCIGCHSSKTRGGE